MMIMQGIVKKSSELKQPSLVKIDHLKAFTSIVKLTVALDVLLALSLHIKTLPSLCILIHYSMYVFARILDA